MNIKTLPPMMGWSTWNLFRQDISEKIVLEMAEAMKNCGLLNAGYCYINLDDCWQASQRDHHGRLSFDAGRFPNKEGIVSRLNHLGFKAGIYSSCGNYTCEDMPGSYGYERLDAETFAGWGIEYLKYDYCHVVDLPTDPHYEKSNFPDHTPPVLYLGISGLGEGGYEKVLHSENARLIAPAYLEAGAVYGLDCPRAAAVFTVNAPAKGMYQLSVGYIKRPWLYRRFLLASVNGMPGVQLWFPPTSGWSATGRVMAAVSLEAGENTITLTNPIRGQQEDSMMRYLAMGEALKNAALPGKPIYYSICEHGRTKPWTWASQVASSWRIGHDIADNWASVMHCYEQAAGLWQYQKPGAYNDPDMLEVGVGNLTETENISHFVLWCMLSAPLVLGLDVRKASEKTLSLITNPTLIAINQDSLQLQASCTTLKKGLDLLVKPLASGLVALCLFNKTDKPLSAFPMPLKALLGNDKRISMEITGGVMVNEVLQGRTWGKVTEILNISALEPHGVCVYLLRQGHRR